MTTTTKISRSTLLKNTPKQRKAISKSPAKAKSTPASKSVRVTKKSQLIKLLSMEKGSTIEALSKKLGWLPHTTRAAITRLKQSGFDVERMPGPDGGTSHYKLKEMATAAQS